MINRNENPDFLNSFLDYSGVILNKSKNTIKEYNYDILNFLKFVDLRPTSKTNFENHCVNTMTLDTLKKVKLEDLHSYLAYLKNELKAQAATRARKVSSIRSFFNYLTQKTSVLEINPAQNLETPKLEKRMQKYLSLDESRDLLTKTHEEENRNNKRDFAIITIFLNCGIRLSELININVKDITFSDCKLNVIGKGNKERTIYLNKACINAINDYIAIRPRDATKSDAKDALFLSERKERISSRTVQYIVKRELQKTGLDINKYSVHKLRHTAATLMYKYGNVDIRALQELLGHESISTTEIYTHVDNSQVRAAVESNPLANM
jgi:site-specific recombinase XerD